MDKSFKSVEEALEYIKPFENWRDYSTAFEKYIDENLETYKNQHAEEYKKIKDDVIKYLTGKGLTETRCDNIHVSDQYSHINLSIFLSLVSLTGVKIPGVIGSVTNEQKINQQNFKALNLKDYKQTMQNIKTGLKEKGFISNENEEDIKNSADKIVRHLEYFKLKFKKEFDGKYKQEKGIKEIPERKVSPSNERFRFWNMIEAEDFIKYLDDYIRSKDKENHPLKRLFSFDYFPEGNIKQQHLLNRICNSIKFKQKSKEDQIKFFKYIGDFFDGVLANDAKRILEEKYKTKSEVIEDNKYELLKEEDNNHDDKNKNAPSQKKFWIGILLLAIVIIVLGVFKAWVFAFLIVPIVLSIMLSKKRNETGNKNLNIKDLSPAGKIDFVDPNQQNYRVDHNPHQINWGDKQP